MTMLNSAGLSKYNFNFDAYRQSSTMELVISILNIGNMQLIMGAAVIEYSKTQHLSC